MHYCSKAIVQSFPGKLSLQALVQADFVKEEG